jgi:hypothetical protein
MEDAAAALALAEPFLLSRPVDHNLVLTILYERRARPQPGLYWAVLDDDEVVGVALRSPLDFVATVTPMSAPAVAVLVDAVIQDAPDLPGINGEACTVAAFAGAWTELTCVAAGPIEAHRLYQLHRTPEPRPVPGMLRRAGAEDEDVLAAWSRSFQKEVGLPQRGTSPRSLGGVSLRGVYGSGRTRGRRRRQAPPRPWLAWHVSTSCTRRPSGAVGGTPAHVCRRCRPTSL